MKASEMDAIYSVDKIANMFHEVPVICDMVSNVSTAVRMYRDKFLQKGTFFNRTHPGPEGSTHTDDPQNMAGTHC